jgi:hypothetical protein
MQKQHDKHLPSLLQGSRKPRISDMYIVPWHCTNGDRTNLGALANGIYFISFCF